MGTLGNSNPDDDNNNNNNDDDGDDDGCGDSVASCWNVKYTMTTINIPSDHARPVSAVWSSLLGFVNNGDSWQ